MIEMGALVISTGGPQSGPKWRNLLEKRISRLRFAALEMTQEARSLSRNRMIYHCKSCYPVKKSVSFPSPVRHYLIG